MTGHKAHRAVFEIYFDYVQHYGGAIHVASLLHLTSQLGLPVSTVRSALCRVTAQGWLERRSMQNKSFYALTALGKERLDEARPRIFEHRHARWDGQWTLLTYSLPERLRHYRDRLRHELSWLGFGPLNAGTWISPRPVVEITLRHLSIRKLDPYVQIFRARQVSSIPHQELVARCWNLKAVQKEYERFIQKWRPTWQKCKREFEIGQPPAESACFASRMRLLHEFGEFLHIDPDLPPELLPEPWAGDEAWRVFRECYMLLAERALNYFEQTFEGPASLNGERQSGRRRVLEGLYQMS